MAKKYLILVLFLFSLNSFANEQSVITPPAGPFVQGGNNTFITGEFLWWQGIQEGLRYATTGILIQPGTSLSSSGTVHSIHYPWESGFRVGVGFYPGHDGWDLYARYTWYQSSSTSRTQNAAGNMAPIAFLLTNITMIQVNGVTSASSHWHLYYNVVDLELGRNFYLSRFFATRLFFGLRGNWIYQNWDTHYTSSQIIFNSGSPMQGTLTTKQNHDSWGIGPRMGLKGTWTFYKGFSLVGDIAASGLWNAYSVHRRDQIAQTTENNASTANIGSSPNTVIANLELLLGLKGDWWFKEEHYHLSAQLAWENQIWIDYGEFIFLTGSNNGDLSFCGLSAKLRFDF